MNKVIVLNNRPVGKPQKQDFKIILEEMPTIGVGEVLLKTRFVSVDPYLRGRMSEAKSYIQPFELNQPVSSGIIGEVVESNNEKFSKGDFVSGLLQWKEYQISTGLNLMKVSPDVAPLSAYLGILGMTGLTAILGLTEIGVPKPGETLVVSGAAGAVGMVVGQIGKILGCRVVGIAGTEQKCEMLKSNFGFDEAINYNTAKNIRKAVANACPDGVDVYFDNVGGDISDGVMVNINKFARIIICGAISQYNATSMPVGPRLQPLLLKNSALMQGFIIGNYATKFQESMQKLTSWLTEGKLVNHETIVDGFDQIPQAFIDLFDGKNTGKMVVKI
jgi:NADPH-dependent curcumin reductase CurA